MARFNPHLSPNGDEAGRAYLQKIRARLQISKDRFTVRSGGRSTNVVAFHSRQYADTHNIQPNGESFSRRKQTLSKGAAIDFGETARPSWGAWRAVTRTQHRRSRINAVGSARRMQASALVAKIYYRLWLRIAIRCGREFRFGFRPSTPSFSPEIDSVLLLYTCRRAERREFSKITCKSTTTY